MSDRRENVGFLASLRRTPISLKLMIFGGLTLFPGKYLYLLFMPVYGYRHWAHALFSGVCISIGPLAFAAGLVLHVIGDVRRRRQSRNRDTAYRTIVERYGDKEKG